jgi:hypothetical protein
MNVRTSYKLDSALNQDAYRSNIKARLKCAPLYEFSSTITSLHSTAQ